METTIYLLQAVLFYAVLSLGATVIGRVIYHSFKHRLTDEG